MSDVLVLCYHAVSPTWPAALSVTPESLERQLTLLARQGWRGATFHDAVHDPPAARTVAVTFDDAYRSVLELALPILERLGLRGTVFAPTAFVSAGGPLAWAGTDHWLRTPHASELTPMGWQQLGELVERGWEIGSHTRTHPRLPGLDDDSALAELAASRAECEGELGTPCRTLAYPYGDVDDRIARLAQRAGYAAGAALSSRLAPLGPYRWPRMGIHHVDEWWRFRLKVAGPTRRARASPLWPERRR
jgi:peptidoglycan/xylan/chitin deacetylase (PgdA/CDA1 family)